MPKKNTTSEEPFNFKQMEFAALEMIFDEGDVGDACYLVTSGEVEIRQGVRSDAPAVLAVLRQGDIFGEMALCGGGKRMAAAIARKKTKVIAISRATFDKQLGAIDPVMRKIIVLLTRRLRQVTEEFASYRRGEHWKERP